MDIVDPASAFESYRTPGGPKADEILAVQREWLREATQSKRLLEDLASAEKGIAQDYAGRFTIELVQNAVDVARKASRLDGRVAFELLADEDGSASLLVANDGAPFTPVELDAICRLGKTSKPPGTAIGHKGLGFKSVLEITDEPWIFSGGYPPAQEDCAR